MEDVEDLIENSVYPIMVTVWSDYLHPHNVAINNCATVHTCILTIGHLDGDRLGNFCTQILLEGNVTTIFLLIKSW